MRVRRTGVRGTSNRHDEQKKMLPDEDRLVLREEEAETITSVCAEACVPRAVLMR